MYRGHIIHSFQFRLQSPFRHGSHVIHRPTRLIPSIPVVPTLFRHCRLIGRLLEDLLIVWLIWLEIPSRLPCIWRSGWSRRDHSVYAVLTTTMLERCDNAVGWLLQVPVDRLRYVIIVAKTLAIFQRVSVDCCGTTTRPFGH